MSNNQSTHFLERVSFFCVTSIGHAVHFTTLMRLLRTLKIALELHFESAWLLCCSSISGSLQMPRSRQRVEFSCRLSGVWAWSHAAYTANKQPALLLRLGYGCMRRTLTTMQLHTQDYDHMIVSHAKASAEAQKGLSHTLTQSAVLPSRDFNSWFFWRWSPWQSKK